MRDCRIFAVWQAILRTSGCSRRRRLKAGCRPWDLCGPFDGHSSSGVLSVLIHQRHVSEMCFFAGKVDPERKVSFTSWRSTSSSMVTPPLHLIQKPPGGPSLADLVDSDFVNIGQRKVDVAALRAVASHLAGCG